MSAATDDQELFDRILTQSTKIAKEGLQIAEWLLVIAALQYVAERYGSFPAQLVAHVLVLGLAVYLVAPTVRYFSNENTSYTKIVTAGAFGCILALALGAAMAVLIDDVVTSNYEITTSSGSDCDPSEDSTDVGKSNLVH